MSWIPLVVLAALAFVILQKSWPKNWILAIVSLIAGLALITTAIPMALNDPLFWVIVGGIVAITVLVFVLRIRKKRHKEQEERERQTNQIHIHNYGR